jgi:DNA polymerase alpha subunit B
MDLMGRILEKKPDVVVLVGPFVDVTQPLLASGDVRLHDYDEDGNVIGSHAASYEVVFIERIVRDALTNLFGEDENLPTNIILVPSLQDAHHECVFPQPPFGDRDEVKTDYFDQSLGVLDIPFSDPNDSRRRVHLLPNPCMFRVNEVLFGVCSTDVLFALSSDEVSHNMPGNRLDRLVAHLLQQQSFCPQFPVPPTSLAQVRPAPLPVSSLSCLPPRPSSPLSLSLYPPPTARSPTRGQVADAALP